MTPMLSFSVRGIPGPQGSKRHVGNGRMIESSAKVKPWRDAVTNIAVQARSAAGIDLLDGPLRVDMVFTFLRPRSHYGTGRNNWLIRSNAPAQPMSAPDLSKLARATEDALNKFAWVDDARVAEYGRLAKVWAGEDPDALDSPGAVIRIYRIGA